MGYSIFEETMADMTYPEIEAAAKENAPVLFPIAVIEEHGPHLCLGTDTYVAYHFCRKIKRSLGEKGIEALMVPPYYWGINHETGAFPGSFTVRRSTMRAVLVDILSSLNRWGFESVFVLNFHGDLQHETTMLDAIKEARIDHGARAYAVLAGSTVQQLGLSGEEEHILVHNPVSPEEKLSEPDPFEYVDHHAGARETSFMALNFPELVDVELARKLKPSKTTREELEIWLRGWSDAKRIAPLGYCGDPSDIDTERMKKLEEYLVECISDLITSFLGAIH